LGKIFYFDEYFSKGLVQPPTRKLPRFCWDFLGGFTFSMSSIWSKGWPQKDLDLQKKKGPVKDTQFGQRIKPFSTWMGDETSV